MRVGVLTDGINDLSFFFNLNKVVQLKSNNGIIPWLRP